MADSTALNTTTSTGFQKDTGTPQASASASDVAGGTPSTIQPSSNGSLLVSNNGIPLQVSPVTTVAVAPTSAQTSAVTPVRDHHINATLLGFSVLLFIVGIALFYFMGRADKSTTRL